MSEYVPLRDHQALMRYLAALGYSDDEILASKPLAFWLERGGTDIDGRFNVCTERTCREFLAELRGVRGPRSHPELEQEAREALERLRRHRTNPTWKALATEIGDVGEPISESTLRARLGRGWLRRS